MQAVCFCHRRAKGMKLEIGKIQIKIEIICKIVCTIHWGHCENSMLTIYMLCLKIYMGAAIVMIQGRGVEHML